ncbi:MAG TPA: ABC transporter substrate-binding protein [Alphaproteobacteria bacterium]|jgi:phospholipid transport system substrate-binding protein
MFDLRAAARIARALAVAAGLALAWTSLVPATALAQEVPPKKVVTDYYAALLDVMRNAHTLGFEGRYKALLPVVKETFDLEFMARYAVRGFWEKLTKAQQDKLVEEFARLSAATYAARFKDYTGEQFKVLNSEPTAQRDVFVRTQIIKSNGEPVAINYLLRERSDEWRVIDVYLRGTISELAKWRADFSSVISREGFDGLLAAIDKKVQALRAE